MVGISTNATCRNVPFLSVLIAHFSPNHTARHGHGYLPYQQRERLATPRRHSLPGGEEVLWWWGLGGVEGALQEGRRCHAGLSTFLRHTSRQSDTATLQRPCVGQVRQGWGEGQPEMGKTGIDRYEPLTGGRKAGKEI